MAIGNFFSSKKPASVAEAAHDDPSTMHKESVNDVESRAIHHSDGSSMHKREGSICSFFGGNDAAKQASAHEQNMTLKYALRYYFPAMLWAILMAAPIIMEGYETATVPTFFEFRSFQHLYGSVPKGKTEGQDARIAPMWQVGITIAASIGQLCGLYVAPRLVNKLGYKKCTLAGLIWASCMLLIGFFSSWAPHSQRLGIFLSGELLLGVPWGLFQALTLPYVSDITPMKLKGPATTMINIFWLVGQLVSSGVLRGVSEIGNPLWEVRVPMLIQYGWLVPLIAIVCMAPDSPLYLTRSGQDEKARQTLIRLNKDPLYDIDGTLAAIDIVNQHETQTTQEMGFLVCFKGGNRRRTEIAVITYLTQQLVGSPLVFYAVKLLKSGGLQEGTALAISMGMYALCIGSTLGSMAVMRRCGRRTMWLGGLGFEIVCLSIIGAASFFHKDGESDTSSFVLAAFLVLFAVVYNMTIGPVCYTIVSETPATRLKASTNSIGRAAYILTNIVNLFLVPVLMDPKPLGLGLGTKAAFVWAGTASICFTWAFFRMPEMKDRTPAEIDMLFESNTPTREWATTKL